MARYYRSRKHPVRSLGISLVVALVFAAATSLYRPGRHAQPPPSLLHRPGQMDWLRTVISPDPENPLERYRTRYIVERVSSEDRSGLALSLSAPSFAGGGRGGTAAPQEGDRNAGLTNSPVLGLGWTASSIRPGLAGEIILQTPYGSWVTTAAALLERGQKLPVEPPAVVAEPATLLAGALLLLPFAASALRLVPRIRSR